MNENRMHYIKDLHIRQFRGLRSVQLQDMQPINLLIGVNNVGKTSMLEAIFTFCRPLDPWAWIKMAGIRESKASGIPMLESLKWLFPRFHTDNPNDLLEGEIGIAGRGLFPVQDITVTFSEFITDISLLEEDEEEFFSGELRRGIDLNLQATARSTKEADPRIFSETFQLWEHERFIQHHKSDCPVLQANLITPYTHQVEQLQLDKFSDTAMRELSASVVPLLRAFDPEIEGLTILSQAGFRRKFYIKHKQLGLAPLSCFGDGVRRVLLMATMIQLSRGGVLLIDELDAAIHPQMLKHALNWLLKMCLQHNIQVFATTHSRETISVFLELSNNLAHIVAYQLERNEAGTTVTRIET